MKKPRVELVIFDLDGTLIDSRPDIVAALNGALTDEGLPTRDAEAIEAMIGDGARELVERAAPERAHDRAAVDRVLARFMERYAQEPVERTRLYPGVREGLAALSSVRRAIATNKPGPMARAIAERLALSPLFDLVLGEGDVPRRKPDPDMLDEAMRRCGVGREATLYVGDGPVDLRTARAAGVPLCLVSWGYRGAAPLEGAAFTIDRFEELVKWVIGGGLN